MDFETARQHGAAFIPRVRYGLAQWIYWELAGHFKGRILSVQDVGALPQFFGRAKKEDREVKVYNT